MKTDPHWKIPDQSCENCRFWLRRTDSAGEMGGGYCRRFPPSFRSGTVGEYLNDGWPYTHQQEWCGEWIGKEPMR